MGDIVLYKSIGERIRNRRKQLHLTQENLAELIDVTPQMISTAENGTKGIRPENVIKLSKALNVSCDYLLTGTSSLDLDIIRQSANQLSQCEFDRFIDLMYLLRNITNKKDNE